MCIYPLKKKKEKKGIKKDKYYIHIKRILYLYGTAYVNNILNMPGTNQATCCIPYRIQHTFYLVDKSCEL